MRITTTIKCLAIILCCLLKTSDVRGDESVPYNYARLHELPLTCIRPEGWLMDYLNRQQAGLTGHLEEIKGRSFEEVRWGKEQLFDVDLNSHYFKYTVPGHWHDAWLRFAYVYGNKDIIEKVEDRYAWTLANPDSDGYIGPRHFSETRPQPLFFRGIPAYYAVRRDPAIIDMMKRHYAALKKRIRKGICTRPSHQGPINIEILSWLYRQTGDKALLKMMKNFALTSVLPPEREVSLEELVNQISCEPHTTLYKKHGASLMEWLMEMADLYLCTGSERYLDAGIKGFKIVENRYGLVDGCIGAGASSHEYTHGRLTWETHETCLTNYVGWTARSFLLATADPAWAERIERVCLNAGIGSVTKDFKALQYFSGPNQIQLETRNFGWYGIFEPGYHTWCCAASVNRDLPNYIGSMWMHDNQRGLVAPLYGPCRVTAEVGEEKQEITIIERTEFPFDETINFQIQCDNRVRFDLKLRIPSWAKNASLTINGEAMDYAIAPGTFLSIEREYADGDVLTLELPMHIATSEWPRNGMAFERGPLVYSLRVDADKKSLRTGPRGKKMPLGDEFPAYEMFPTSDWNYAWDVDRDKLDEQVKVIFNPLTDNPWDDEAKPPVCLEVPVKRVENWEMIRDRKGRPVFPTDDNNNRKSTGFAPELPHEGTMQLADEQDKITLVPLGATCLRMTILPDIKKEEMGL